MHERYHQWQVGFLPTWSSLGCHFELGLIRPCWQISLYGLPHNKKSCIKPHHCFTHFTPTFLLQYFTQAFYYDGRGESKVGPYHNGQTSPKSNQTWQPRFGHVGGAPIGTLKIQLNRFNGFKLLD